jgi:mono/diheme cytochrome c family protein
MKKMIYSSILVLFIIGACHKKALPVITARTEEPPPPAKTTPPVALTSPAIEAGQVIYTTKCVRCHNAKPVQRWTVEDWKPILRSMIPKAKLDSTQSAQVTAYVEAFARKQ